MLQKAALTSPLFFSNGAFQQACTIATVLNSILKIKEDQMAGENGKNLVYTIQYCTLCHAGERIMPHFTPEV